MRNIFIFLFCYLPALATAQFRESSGDEFEIKVPENVASYSIYCHSTSEGWQQSFQGAKMLIKKVVTRNGREVKITEFDAGRISSIEYRYFTKGLLQKVVVNYTHPVSREVYYYQYNSLSDQPADVKGYKDKKLVYTESRTVKRDTLEIKRHFIHVNGIKAKEREITCYSKDSLTKTQISYRNHSDFFSLLITRYNTSKQVMEEVDSSGETCTKKSYQYDRNGRITGKSTVKNNETESSTFTYDPTGRLKEEIYYLDGKEIYRIAQDSSLRENVSTKYINQVSELKDTISRVTKRYDTEGNLVFEEHVQYDNKGPGTATVPVNTSVCHWIYEQQRLVKYMYRDNGGGPTITYDVTYQYQGTKNPR